MNSSSTYLSSHQAAENPSATCRLTGDDSIAHKESALYLKARNLSSIHDGMPNLCRIPDGCGLVYIKMPRLSSFFCQIFEPSQKRSENIGIFIPVFFRSVLPPHRQGTVPQRTGWPLPSSPHEGANASQRWRYPSLLPLFHNTRGKRNKFWGQGPDARGRRSPSPQKPSRLCASRA